VNLLNKNVMNIDRMAFVVMMVLIGIGIVMVYSASLEVAKLKYHSSAFFLGKQLIRIGFAFVLFYLVLNTDYRWIADKNRIFIMIAFGFLLYLLLSNGISSIKGAKRWISLGGLTIQPSDMARLVVIIYMARMLVKNEKALQEGLLEPLLSMLALPAVTAVLIIFQPNFSTAFILSMIVFTMLFAGGLRMRYIAFMGTLSIPVILYVVLKTPYRLARLKAFLHPESHAGSYQALQSLIGLGSGHVFGVGLGESSQKLLFLPEPYTDFVFSILGEEFGFVGIVLVFALFGLLVYRGYRIALNAPDRLGYYLALGITASITYYVFIHACVVSVLMPTTGIPLPFLSYGGSNLLFNMIAMGILLNISGQAKQKGRVE